MATLFLAAFAIGGWRSGLSRLSDNSFLWHLRTGRYILAHGLPRHDLYSFSAPHASWVVQSWLAEVLYAVADKLAGPFGVRVFGALTGAAVASTAFALTHRITGDRIRAVGVALASIGASFTLWSERPLFLGILLFVFVLWVVEVPDSTLGRRPLIALPVLFWLWANIHGTFSLGFVYLGLHVLGRWLDGAPPWEARERTLVVATAIAFVACFANPYGFALVTFPVHLLGRGDILETVVEWRSPNFRTVQGIALAGWLVVFVAVLARGAHRPSRRDLVVTLPFVLLALWAQRNIAVAPLVALPVMARAVATGTDRADTPTRVNAVFAVVLALMAALFFVNAGSEPNFDTRTYPVQALRYVESHGLLGRRLLADDGTGGYIIIKYWPRQRVFVDDRFDMYPLPVLHDFLALTAGSPRSRAVLDRRKLDVVVWDGKAPLSTLLAADPGWQRVFRSRKADVFVRRR
jgi:hypothetical protein